jgi:hypothetical protein
MIRLICLSAIVTIVIIGCNNNSDSNDSNFNGKINWIDDMFEAEKVTLKEIELDGAFYGIPTVCDSFMIFWNYKLPKSFFNIFNLNTGEYIGDFCNRGGGAEEAHSLPYVYQVYKDNGTVTTLLDAANEQKLFIWDISKSIVSRTTVFDTVIPYGRSSEHETTNYLYMFRLDKDTLITRVNSELLSIDGDMASVPYYRKRTVYSNQQVRDYRIYNNEVIKKGKSHILPNFFYSSSDCIKPDRSKIVQGMRRLCQINIIDLASGQVTGHRIKNTPDFSLFNTDIKNIKEYYMHIQADDSYIYALYLGEEVEDSRFSTKPYNPHIIFIFDWDGNLIKKIDLGHPVMEIAIDDDNNLLYSTDVEEDKLYCFDLNQLNLK